MSRPDLPAFVSQPTAGSKYNSHGFHGPLTEQETVAQCGENCLPERVLGNVTEFWLCKNDACKQIYWASWLACLPVPPFAALCRLSRLFQRTAAHPTGRLTPGTAHDDVDAMCGVVCLVLGCAAQLGHPRGQSLAAMFV